MSRETFRFLLILFAFLSFMTIVISFVGVAVITSAQTNPEPPLVALVNGEMLIFDGEALVPYPECQPEGQRTFGALSRSADGEWIAFMGVPQFVLEAGNLGVAQPLDVWACNTTRSELIHVASQPEDAVYSMEQIANVIQRGAPVWSPEGASLAFTELPVPSPVPYLAVYDLNAGTGDSYPLLEGFSEGDLFGPPPLMWAEDGLVVSEYRVDPETFIFEERGLVYDSDGFLQTVTILEGGGETDDFVLRRLLVEADGQQYVALRYNNAGWIMIDLMTGERIPMAGDPELVAVSAPDGISLSMSLLDDGSAALSASDPAAPDLTFYSLERVAIGPEGQRLAYADTDLNLWPGGEIIPGSEGFADDFSASMVWAVTEWRAP